MNPIEFIKNNQDRIILFVGFIFVFIFGFFSGYFYLDGKSKKENVSIEEPSGECSSLFNKNDKPNIESTASDQNTEIKSSGSANLQEAVKKVFVASKNGKVYHKPNCSYAAKIKEENKIWFSSEEEAKQKGYSRHEHCFK